MATNSFGWRKDTLLSFYDYICTMNIDPRAFFSLHTTNCLGNLYSGDNCKVDWTEYAWQVTNWPSRMSLSKNIQEAEKRIRNVLAENVGPTYMEGETHALGPRWWSKPLRLRTRNVITGGTRVFHKIDLGAIAQTVVLEDPREWGFEEEIVYTMMVDLGTNWEQIISNLEVYEEGIVDLDPHVEGRRGHRLRPFKVSYDPDTLMLEICLPKVVAVRLNAYSRLPLDEDMGKLRRLDFCDIGNFITRLDIYWREYQRPDGTIYIRGS